MADLKAGSTVGGLPIWHQGTMPLVPAGNSLTYRGYKVYTTNDKPQAADNDFVSKSSGGTYTGGIKIVYGNSGQLNLGPNNGLGFRAGGQNGEVLVIGGGNAGGSIQFRPVGMEESGTMVEIDRNGNVDAKVGRITANVFTSRQAPTATSDLTRKDYVDNAINTVTNNANSRVLKAGDTMTGTLTVPTVVLTKAATADNQAPQRGQVVLKGTVIDFGSY